ncbi:acyl-CoA dehydrogenase family protein, partial [Streptomyces sp. NPDC057052]|uniref:acyl-CoA dehydrogenase family protein n=1 Tax=Streptomyces sp. NPDC057052 TaxID=3346010 RepID=UPI0036341F71
MWPGVPPACWTPTRTGRWGRRRSCRRSPATSPCRSRRPPPRGRAPALVLSRPPGPVRREAGHGAPPPTLSGPAAVLLTAAGRIGGATRACGTAVQHARPREQFGRPIGAFPAVGHPCADPSARAEAARAPVGTAGPAG